MEQFLMKKIESIRNQMVQESFNQSQLTNEKVVTLSQKLDRYINLYQRFKNQASNVTSNNQSIQRSNRGYRSMLRQPLDAFVNR